MRALPQQHRPQAWRTGLAALCGYVLAAVGPAAEHPRLLVAANDVARLKHACGLGTPLVEATAAGRFGAHSADFQALRAHLARLRAYEPLPGELAARAFLHVVAGDDPADAQRLKDIQAGLLGPALVATDPFEVTVVLDWCWDALDPAVRNELLLELRQTARPLTPADSPLDHRVFRAKLAALAAVLAVDESDEPGSAWNELRRKLLAAGRSYFETTFPRFVALRGLSPTSPSAAAWEESDTALALELGSRLLEKDLWSEYRASVGRWAEHYLLASRTHPAVRHQFVRDDGYAAPLTPAVDWGEFLPVTAHLIAARTRDPAAATVADEVEAALRGLAGDPQAILWRWVPIVFDTRDMPRCDLAKLPVARNLGGAVVFRGGGAPQETVVWIEAGQPFLRRRQHFDAGHFLIHGGGHLAVGGGDDVAFEAVPSKLGSQHLGDESEPFDFDQYFAATIAHNGLVVWDAAQVMRWHGKPFAAVGNQCLFEETCQDFSSAPAAHPRAVARQLAYGQRGSCAYLALDLGPAYDRRLVQSYTREFVFLCGRALVIVDRLQLRHSRAIPTWVINIPARPLADGRELSAEQRIAGSDNRAGVWQVEPAAWLRWSDGDGALWLRSLFPEQREVRIVGGPAQKLVVTDGPAAGTTYVGGAADSFERLVIPSGRHKPRDAWYRLGRPTLLGPLFGKVPHWGRIEIEPAERSASALFVTLLVVDRADRPAQPEAEITLEDTVVRVQIDLQGKRVEVELDRLHAARGSVRLSGDENLEWTLPTQVTADEPLATQ